MDGYLRVVRGKEHLRCHAQTQSWLEQCGINEEWLERVIIITPSRGEDAVLLEVRKVEAAANPLQNFQDWKIVLIRPLCQKLYEEFKSWLSNFRICNAQRDILRRPGALSMIFIGLCVLCFNLVTHNL